MPLHQNAVEEVSSSSCVKFSILVLTHRNEHWPQPLLDVSKASLGGVAMRTAKSSLKFGEKLVLRFRTERPPGTAWLHWPEKGTCVCERHEKSA